MRAAYLPSLRGYGKLPDLHIAISNDNDGTGNILDLVTNFEEISVFESATICAMELYLGILDYGGQYTVPVF